jgi:sec-independent protein translocase protein TatA
MGLTNIWVWVVILLVVLLLFGGRGKISSLMGDFGKGLKSFKSNMKDEGEAEADAPKKAVTDESGSASSADANKSDQATKS